MIINTQFSNNNSTLEVIPEGRLDTITSPELTAALEGLKGITTLIFNFEKLDYISSAGLRVLLASEKTMKQQGSMVVKNVNESIMEIFDITGFSDILTIE